MTISKIIIYAENVVYNKEDKIFEINETLESWNDLVKKYSKQMEVSRCQ